MERRSPERLVRNEALFRQANEGIENGLWPDEWGQRVPFRCECVRIDCGQTVELTALEYERVRAYPRRFIVATGHALPDVEVVVERHADHLIVEKQDTAGDIAEQLDPRT